jgi:hypothetical protein
MPTAGNPDPRRLLRRDFLSAAIGGSQQREPGTANFGHD